MQQVQPDALVIASLHALHNYNSKKSTQVKPKHGQRKWAVPYSELFIFSPEKCDNVATPPPQIASPIL